MDFIYYKELNLDNENNYTVNIAENNAVESQKYIGGDEYLISGLDLKPKTVLDFTKWKDHDEIKAIFDTINSEKKLTT